jgi:hypothetical protein
VTELDFQKELLKTKIEAHRTVLGLEVRATRMAFDPLGLALSLVGFDRETIKVLGPVLHAVVGGLGDLARSKEPEAAAESAN